MPPSAPDQKAADVSPTDTRDTPRVGYWHIWTDDKGVSHQDRCALDRFSLKGIGGAAAQWNDAQPDERATVVFTVQPVGWVGEWHENPAPQWIVPLTGRWWVESMDGTRVEMGPGDLSLGEDQNCVADAKGRKGHRSGTIGSEPAVLMTVRLGDRIPRRPCHRR